MKIIDKLVAKLKGRSGTDTKLSVIASDSEAIPEQHGIASSPEAPRNDMSNIGESKMAEQCPYCKSGDFVKRGKRRKKLEVVQLYLCRNPECGRTFTAQLVKGKRYPMNLVIEGLNYYNLGFGLEQTCRLLREKFGTAPEPSTLDLWLTEYEKICPYGRLRPYGKKLYPPEQTVEVTAMAHRQIYKFRYHRAKTALILKEDYKHRKFEPLRDYLDGVSSETPHQYFQDGLRISEVRSKFEKAEMIVRTKFNYANHLARFVLQAVKENKFRHDALQRFFIANDSVTVASEVPVYIKKESIVHYENELGFKVLVEGEIKVKGGKVVAIGDGVLLTGHIDLVQIRNGQIHLLDFKPRAARERPIEQLTWYALALSRLTGLRLYEFKCAWFDDQDYFEFYPLHVVYKLRPPKKKRVRFKTGLTVDIPTEDELKII